MLGDIDLPELLVIFTIGLVLFGPGKLPGCKIGINRGHLFRTVRLKSLIATHFCTAPGGAIPW